MPVNTTHTLYDKYSDDWLLMRASVDGQKAIKDRKTTYLPEPTGMEAAQDAAEAASKTGPYDNYLARAMYPAWVAEAVRVMVGMAFDKPARVELPRGMEGIEERVSTLGEPLEVFAKRIVAEVLLTGRYGLLADVAANGTPYIAGYVAESLINWQLDESISDALAQLSLAVLSEQYTSDDADLFKPTMATQYRVLQLVEGAYASSLWRSAGGAWFAVEDSQVIPRTARNRAFNEIPLTIAGSTDIHPDPDQIPLLGMARNALKYYQLSADYYHSLYLTANPTPVISGITDADAPDSIGSSSLWALSDPQAKAYYLEVSGNGIDALRSAMQDTHVAALEAGAKIMEIDDAESGTAKHARQRDQQATLRSVVKSTGMAIESSLKHLAVYFGADPETVVYEPSLEFVDAAVNAQLITALNNAVVTRTVPRSVLWETLRQGKLTKLDDDELIEATEADNAIGLAGEV